jgi:hypothetical protein
MNTLTTENASYAALFLSFTFLYTQTSWKYNIKILVFNFEYTSVFSIPQSKQEILGCWLPAGVYSPTSFISIKILLPVIFGLKTLCKCSQRLWTWTCWIFTYIFHKILKENLLVSLLRHSAYSQFPVCTLTSVIYTVCCHYYRKMVRVQQRTQCILWSLNW